MKSLLAIMIIGTIIYALATIGNLWIVPWFGVLLLDNNNTFHRIYCHKKNTWSGLPIFKNQLLDWFLIYDWYEVLEKLSHHDLKQVSLQRKTYDRLRQFGHTPDTFDLIVQRVLDLAEQQKEQQRRQQENKRQQQHKIAVEAALTQ